ncbi:YciI family protein [Streptomyces sp. NPDC020965]|uniref:YciI family protein n=1 Tax=Streptomyces sp. NPDC020965 TaxID=3365105 RepID=UPI0037BD08F4
MKYLVMVQSTQAEYAGMAGQASPNSPAWSESDLKAMFDFMGAIDNDLAESGELVDAQGLTEPARARTVEVDPQGRPVITDGPYGETKEVLAGYWVLDCESLERVTEIATRISLCPIPAGAVNYPIVIRPLQGTGGGDV